MALAQIAATRRRRRLGRRVPGRNTRRALSARPPRAAALALNKAIRGRLELVERAFQELLFPVLPELEPPPEGEGSFVRSEPDDPVDRVDAVPLGFIARRLEAIQLRIGVIFDEADLQGELETIGKRVSKTNATHLKRVVGVAIEQADPGVAALVEGWRAINVSRIQSLVDTELVQITDLLRDAQATGLRVEALAKQIRERFEVSKSKASLLARDQTLTLNSQIARQRQTNLGIEKYIWSTSGDGLVRDTHAELDGTEQRWDEPPIISEDGRRGHPGDDYQCRCTAYPVLPELA